jgi:HAD superfamily hydrolase (TIGR01509 family)
MSTLVLFDLDGTLIDVEHGKEKSGRDGFAAITADIAQSQGVPLDTQSAFRYAGLSFKDRFNKISRSYDHAFAPEALESMHDEYQRRKREIFGAPEIPLIEGAQALIGRLAANPDDFTLGVASSNASTRTRAVLSKTGLSAYFNELVFGSDMTGGLKKPDPAIFNLAISSTGHTPQETVIVEDSIPGVKAARAAGAFVVAHLDPRMATDPVAQEKAFRKAGADLVVRDYNQFESEMAANWNGWPAMPVRKAI